MIIVLLFTHMTYPHFFFISHLFFFNIIYKYSLAKDLVDMDMAVDQAQGSQEKHLDTVVMDRDLILSQARDMGVTDQARAVANLVRDHLVDTDMDREVILSQAREVRVNLVRFMYLFMDVFLRLSHLMFIISHTHHLLI